MHRIVIVHQATDALLKISIAGTDKSTEKDEASALKINTETFKVEYTNEIKHEEEQIEIIKTYRERSA